MQSSNRIITTFPKLTDAKIPTEKSNPVSDVFLLPVQGQSLKQLCRLISENPIISLLLQNINYKYNEFSGYIQILLRITLPG